MFLRYLLTDSDTEILTVSVLVIMILHLELFNKLDAREIAEKDLFVCASVSVSFCASIIGLCLYL